MIIAKRRRLVPLHSIIPEHTKPWSIEATRVPKPQPLIRFQFNSNNRGTTSDTAFLLLRRSPPPAPRRRTRCWRAFTFRQAFSRKEWPATSWTRPAENSTPIWTVRAVSPSKVRTSWVTRKSSPSTYPTAGSPNSGGLAWRSSSSGSAFSTSFVSAMISISPSASPPLPFPSITSSSPRSAVAAWIAMVFELGNSNWETENPPFPPFRNSIQSNSPLFNYDYLWTLVLYVVWYLLLDVDFVFLNYFYFLHELFNMQLIFLKKILISLFFFFKEKIKINTWNVFFFSTSYYNCTYYIYCRLKTVWWIFGFRHDDGIN